tara:strand:- start:7230 stop:7382 length:153 start_codon:yes stop_codon:yes gene_type:complete
MREVHEYTDRQTVEAIADIPWRKLVKQLGSKEKAMIYVCDKISRFHPSTN